MSKNKNKNKPVVKQEQAEAVSPDTDAAVEAESVEQEREKVSQIPNDNPAPNVEAGRGGPAEIGENPIYPAPEAAQGPRRRKFRYIGMAGAGGNATPETTNIVEAVEQADEERADTDKPENAE